MLRALASLVNPYEKGSENICLVLLTRVHLRYPNGPLDVPIECLLVSKTKKSGLDDYVRWCARDLGSGINICEILLILAT